MKVSTMLTETVLADRTLDGMQFRMVRKGDLVDVTITVDGKQFTISYELFEAEHRCQQTGVVGDDDLRHNSALDWSVVEMANVLLGLGYNIIGGPDGMMVHIAHHNSVGIRMTRMENGQLTDDVFDRVPSV